jgi:hypothetical protein
MSPLGGSHLSDHPIPSAHALGYPYVAAPRLNGALQHPRIVIQPEA